MQSVNLDTAQTYDNEGKVLTVKYPDAMGFDTEGTYTLLAGATYTYTYDAMSRPITLTDDQQSPVNRVTNCAVRGVERAEADGLPDGDGDGEQREAGVWDTKVSGSSNLTDFPLLISVTDANPKTVANGGSVGKSDGTDILLTASDGATKLNRELESYSPNAGSTAAWVRIPGVSASINTHLYLLWQFQFLVYDPGHPRFDPGPESGVESIRWARQPRSRWGPQPAGGGPGGLPPGAGAAITRITIPTGKRTPSRLWVWTRRASRWAWWCYR